MIPGTPLRTAAYLAFYVVVAALASFVYVILSFLPFETWAAVALGLVVVVSIGAGLLIRVTVEPEAWRWTCRARNAALCAALLLCTADLALFIYMNAAFSGWQGE